MLVHVFHLPSSKDRIHAVKMQRHLSSEADTAAIIFRAVKVETFTQGFLKKRHENPLMPRSCLTGIVKVVELQGQRENWGGSLFTLTSPAERKPTAALILNNKVQKQKKDLWNTKQNYEITVTTRRHGWQPTGRRKKKGVLCGISQNTHRRPLPVRGCWTDVKDVGRGGGYREMWSVEPTYTQHGHAWICKFTTFFVLPERFSEMRRCRHDRSCFTKW